MTTWTIAGELDICGYDGEVIPVGEPMQEMRREGMKRVLKRCAQHAHGAVDWVQIDQAKHDAEIMAAADAEADPPAVPVRRVKPGQPKDFAQFADVFDAKALRLGKDA